MNYYYDPEYEPANKFWYCNVRNNQNHILDGECQFCDCEAHQYEENSG